MNTTFPEARSLVEILFIKPTFAKIELFFDIKTVFTLNWIVTYNCLNSLK